LVAAGPQRGVATGNLPLQSLQVTEYKEPTKAAAAQLKLLQALEAGHMFQSAMIKAKPEVKVNAQEHHGFKLNSLRVTWDFSAVEKQPNGKAMVDAMKAMLGEGMSCWFGTNGKVVVQVAAKDWPAARQMLDQYLDGKAPLGEQPAFQATRKQLPAQASMVMAVNMPLYVQAISQVVSPMLAASGLPFNIPVIKADQAKPTYVGATVQLQPERGSLEVWLPATAVIEVRKMIEPVLKNLQGQ
jgi:hypothetical protein